MSENSVLKALNSLTPQERVKMISLGLSPLNLDHVRAFKKGDVQKLVEEKKKYVSKMIEGTRNNLGSGIEQDISPEKFLGREYEETSFRGSLNNASVKDMREALREDMQGYTNSSMSTHSLGIGSDFAPPRQQREQQSVSDNNYFSTGYSMGKTYINLFVSNIQNPNPNSRIELFKSLRQIFEFEQKIKTNAAALNSFRKGVADAEVKFYEKIS